MALKTILARIEELNTSIDGLMLELKSLHNHMGSSTHFIEMQLKDLNARLARLIDEAERLLKDPHDEP
jgi:hypothetical protein